LAARPAGIVSGMSATGQPMVTYPSDGPYRTQIVLAVLGALLVSVLARRLTRG
jgi:hypothetical protein